MSEATLTKDQIEELRFHAESSLYFFAKGVLGLDWLDGEIHMPLCEKLENYKDNTRMQFVLPRGWLKTTLCSQAYPMWRACKDPSIRVLLTQNTYKNAVSKLKPIKANFESNPLLRTLFPEVLPNNRSTWTGDSLCLNRPKAFNESTFEAAGVRTQVTSRHYDIIIEDDTVAPDFDELGGQALLPTKDQVEQAIGWHRLASPLLTDLKKGQILVVGTRWYEKDLLSYIQENEPQYKICTRACLENELGEPDENGRPTYPARFDMEVINDLRRTMGTYLFSCLYMNKPIRSEDMVFQPEWFKFYEVHPVLNRLSVFTTVDLAGDPENQKGDPDYNIVMTTGKDMLTGHIYILDYFRKRCNPGEVIDAIFNHVNLWNPIKVGVEGVAYQGTLAYWIRERMRKENRHFFVECFTHGRRSKSSRIMGLQPLIANGTILMKRYMVDLISELQAFPLGAHDDLIDSLASQLPLWGKTKTFKEEKMVVSKNDPFLFDNIIKEFATNNNVTDIERVYRKVQ